MKRIVSRLVGPILLLVFCQVMVYSQTTGSISGAVVDANGAVVPAATVVIKGEGGQQFTVVTNDSGLYRVPSVATGVYTVTITAPNFKKSVVENVKVDVGLPSTANVTLEAGDVSETVVVTGGGEVLQTQTATIGTTLTGRQIIETPIASRDALDLVGLLPGTATVGRPRSASINGLPKGSLSITIDGVDVQDNLLRSSDGYFTYVRPRVDAIDEVTVSTANPGAESGGDGAVQIRFVTRRGTNDYTGGLYWQHRDESLNANYWYQNRDGARDANGEAFRQKIRLNQYGGRLGGPLPFPRFGIGGKWFDSGKDRSFFFTNYEEFRQPESLSRTRNILSTQAQSGIYQYIVGSTTNSVNVFNIAAAAACSTCTSTPDPTVGALLTQIRSAVGTTGTVTNVTNSPNLQQFNFTPQGAQKRKFLALRFDVNVTKDHSVEFVVNRQQFVPSKDFLNSQDERFPGMPWYTQGSDRDSYATAVRSSFGKHIVNEARHTISTGRSAFSPGISPADYAYQGGYDLAISAASFGGLGLTTATARNSYSARNSPTYDFTDSVTWLAGSHSINFGGQYKRIKLLQDSIGRIVPTISFGIDATDPANGVFNTTSMPGASATQLAEARALYAVLVGRVTGYTTTAYLTGDGTYKENAFRTQNDRQDTYGLFAQDSWKIRPNLTVNFGLRWQPQGAYTILTGNYARLQKYEQIYGLSGPGNLFKPGTLTGEAPLVVGMEIGEKAFDDDLNNYGPSFGAVWSPDFGDNGFLKTVFGGPGKSVFRGGFSRSFVREGTALIGSLLGANPGGSLSATRSISLGNMTVGSNLRTSGNPNLTPAPFISSPAYPLSLSPSNSANAFDPNLKTGSVDSFSFGYQRELDRNTVLEVRYVGNRGTNLWRQHNLNELNTIENGFAAEYALAQANLYQNIAAGRGQTYAYFGAGTNTSPLPLILSYINSAATFDPSNPARYNSTLFTNSTLIAQLSRNNPSVIGFAGNIENNATRRANALANGRPSNFFYVNSTTLTGGAYVLDNSADSWYDSMVIEARRRLTNGLRVQASYVWSKAQSNSFQSNSDNFANYTHRDNGLDLAKNVAVFDVRHQFKFDATYDLPFGKGRQFFSNSNWLADALIGGFSIMPTVRWQSGTPFSYGNVQLVGMTVDELQKEIKVRKGTNVVTYLPDDIILNTQRAFDINVTNTNTNGGYGTTYGTGGPQGRFIAPAGYGNCQSKYAGECGFNNLILYGPSSFKLDVGIAKRFRLAERRNIEFRATFLDALNMPNFRVGGWSADVITVGLGGSTFGQLGNGSAYQDTSTTNDPGGRLIDIMFRFNF